MNNADLQALRLSPNFAYHELFPKFMCETFAAAQLDGLMDPRILNILEEVRKDLGPVYVNNWFWNGRMQWRGFRTPGSPWYSPGSAHSFGQAVDFNVKGHTPAQIHEHLFVNEEKYLKLGLTRLEHVLDAPTWVHADVKFTGKNHIHVFRV